MQENTHVLRKKLLDKVLSCISGITPHLDLIDFAEEITQKQEVHHDIPLLQSVAVLDFLARQIANGNEDVLTRDLVEEGYVYIVNKLTPTV